MNSTHRSDPIGINFEGLSLLPSILTFFGTKLIYHSVYLEGRHIWKLKLFEFVLASSQLYSTILSQKSYVITLKFTKLEHIRNAFIHWFACVYVCMYVCNHSELSIDKQI